MYTEGRREGEGHMLIELCSVAMGVVVRRCSPNTPRHLSRAYKNIVSRKSNPIESAYHHIFLGTKDATFLT